MGYLDRKMAIQPSHTSHKMPLPKTAKNYGDKGPTAGTAHQGTRPGSDGHAERDDLKIPRFAQYGFFTERLVQIVPPCLLRLLSSYFPEAANEG